MFSLMCLIRVFSCVTGNMSTPGKSHNEDFVDNTQIIDNLMFIDGWHLLGLLVGSKLNGAIQQCFPYSWTDSRKKP